MFLRSPPFIGLLAILTVAVGAGFFQQRQVAAGLRAEQIALRLEDQQLPLLRSERDRLIADLAEKAEAATPGGRTPYPRSPDATNRVAPREHGRKTGPPF